MGKLYRDRIINERRVFDKSPRSHVTSYEELSPSHLIEAGGNKMTKQLLHKERGNNRKIMSNDRDEYKIQHTTEGLGLMTVQQFVASNQKSELEMAFCTSALGQDHIRTKTSPKQPSKRGNQTAGPRNEEQNISVLALG